MVDWKVMDESVKLHARNQVEDAVGFRKYNNKRPKHTHQAPNCY